MDSQWIEITSNVNGSFWFRAKWDGEDIEDWAYRSDDGVIGRTETISRETIKGWLESEK